MPIDETFTYDGYEFKLLKRKRMIALYEKHKPTHQDSCFEVVIIQVHPPVVLNGKQYPERESMPRTDEWGTYGWSFCSLEAARKKFNALI